MEHEPVLPQEKEQSPDLPKPVFDLEQMEPEQVATLIDALGFTWQTDLDNGDKAPEFRQSEISRVLGLIHKDLSNFVERNPEAARKLYDYLMENATEWPRGLAGECMTLRLINQNLDDEAARQKLIDPWVELLNDEDEATRVIATQIMWGVIESDWIDEPTARYLNDKLQPDDQIDI